jgi:uncharacterized membrane protein YkvA (DUF1232 family)
MDQKPSSIIPSRGVLSDLTIRLKLIGRLMIDRRVNFFAKLIPVAAFAYLVSPIDLIPGIALPIIGALDDAAIVWLGAYFFIELCPPEVVREHTKKLISSNDVVNDEQAKADDIVDGEATEIKDDGK